MSINGIVSHALALAMVVGPGAINAQPAIGTAATAAADVTVLDKAQVDALLAQPGDVLFLDVRRADEISAIGSVPAFLNIQASELERFLPAIPRERRIVTISNHAGRAKRAAALLTARGFTVAGALGIEDYSAAGGAVSGRRFVTPAIAGVVAANTRVEVVREGFEGTEGPVRLPDGSILFTENRADRIVRIAPDNGVSTYLDKTGSANALAVNRKGELLAVQTAQPGVAVLQPAGRRLAATFGKLPFNRPNDLAVTARGDIYFSDPGAAPQAGIKAALHAVGDQLRILGIEGSGYRLDVHPRGHPVRAVVGTAHRGVRRAGLQPLKHRDHVAGHQHMPMQQHHVGLRVVLAIEIGKRPSRNTGVGTTALEAHAQLATQQGRIDRCQFRQREGMPRRHQRHKGHRVSWHVSAA